MCLCPAQQALQERGKTKERESEVRGLLVTAATVVTAGGENEMCFVSDAETCWRMRNILVRGQFRARKVCKTRGFFSSFFQNNEIILYLKNCI